MPQMKHPHRDDVAVIPDALEEQYAAKGWTPVTAAAPAVEVPDGEPSESWTVAQLEAYAAANGVDLAGASRKADILAAISGTH